MRWWASLLDNVIEEPTAIIAPELLEEEAHDGYSGIDPFGRHGGRLVMHQEVHRTPHLVWRLREGGQIRQCRCHLGVCLVFVRIATWDIAEDIFKAGDICDDRLVSRGRAYTSDGP